MNHTSLLKAESVFWLVEEGEVRVIPRLKTQHAVTGLETEGIWASSADRKQGNGTSVLQLPETKSATRLDDVGSGFFPKACR